MNRARVKLVVVALLVFLVVIQVVQPRRTNPASVPSRALSAHTIVPDDVQASLMRACGDCHSNQTRWPWYSHVAPFSWVITDDVNEGRRHMNFEDWESQQDPSHGDQRIGEICKEIRQNGMPPFSYRLAHREIRLKTNEIAPICSWSQSASDGPAPLPAHER
jgi:hypothetical protein